MAGEQEAVSTAPVTEHSESDLDSYFDESPEDLGSESAPEGTPESSDESASQAEAQPEEVEAEAEEGQDEGTPEAEEAEAPEPYVLAGREFATKELADQAYREAQTAMQEQMARAKVLQEQNDKYSAMLQGAVGNPAADQAAAKPNPYAGMDADAVDAALAKGGYNTFSDMAAEAIVDSGLLAEAVRQAEVNAERKLWARFEPLVDFLTEVKVDRDLDALRKDENLAGIIPEIEKDIRARISAPGNTDSVKTIVNELLAKRAPSAQKELAELRASIKAKTTKNATASAATKGSGVVTSKGTAAAKPAMEDEYFGSVDTKEDIAGTGLRVAT